MPEDIDSEFWFGHLYLFRPYTLRYHTLDRDNRSCPSQTLAQLYLERFQPRVSNQWGAPPKGGVERYQAQYVYVFEMKNKLALNLDLDVISSLTIYEKYRLKTKDSNCKVVYEYVLPGVFEKVHHANTSTHLRQVQTPDLALINQSPSAVQAQRTASRKRLRIKIEARMRSEFNAAYFREIQIKHHQEHCRGVDSNRSVKST
ncbi:hypothetical protein EVAR_24901_1 [Eumeta japonica]|uniref:Uncharacterized protein n=1 Tax=Eumeta variegata TaxID=151549 RepID=A0A4C1V6U3_EUMVA|nr:hypothetical protein EVAR_24901_1 [Eumeta japonica]